MNEHESIIFDMDGTLWNASESSAKGWNAALASYGLSGIVITPRHMESVAGLPLNECVRALITDESAASDPHLLETIDAHEKITVEDAGGTPFEGVVEGIEALAARYPLFLVSNCQDWYLAAFWRHVPVERFFRASLCHGATGASKAEMIGRTVDAHRLRNSIYIGDTDGDERAARAAGIGFGFAEYGFGKARRPDLRFRSFSHIVDWFAKPSHP